MKKPSSNSENGSIFSNILFQHTILISSVKEEEYLKQQYNQIVSSEIEISSKLKEKYGDINIDIKTGDITYPKI